MSKEDDGVVILAASKKYILPCPSCGAVWPIVQAKWCWPRGQREKREIVLCCTRCCITGTRTEKQESTP